jgi:hypothetical protein
VFGTLLGKHACHVENAIKLFFALEGVCVAFKKLKSWFFNQMVDVDLSAG